MAFEDTQADATILYGDDQAVIELAGTVTKGDALGFSSGWKRALATTGGVIQIRCVAAEDGVTGQEIIAYFGTVLMDDRLSGMTAGGALYVAEGTDNGEYTEALPSTSGDSTKVCGYSLTATLAAILPNLNVDTTKA